MNWEAIEAVGEVLVVKMMEAEDPRELQTGTDVGGAAPGDGESGSSA